MAHHIKAINTLQNIDKETLISKIQYLEAEQNTRLANRAATQLKKVSEKVMIGSSIVLTITSISGTELICPLAIRDGLTENTINAIIAELHKSNIVFETYNR